MTLKPWSLRRLMGGLAGLIVVSLLLGFGLGFLSAVNPEGDNGLISAGATVIVVVVMAAAVAVGVGWMRSIDEAAQEAHKSAWYWGGSVGLAIGGTIAMLATLPQAESWRLPSLLADRTDPAAYAATGAFALMALMIGGYVIAWAIWWLRRR